MANERAESTTHELEINLREGEVAWVWFSDLTDGVRLDGEPVASSRSRRLGEQAFIVGPTSGRTLSIEDKPLTGRADRPTYKMVEHTPTSDLDEVRGLELAKDEFGHIIMTGSSSYGSVHVECARTCEGDAECGKGKGCVQRYDAAGEPFRICDEVK